MTGHPVDERAAAGLAARHEAALARLRTGDVETAIPLLEQILLGCRAALGEHHPGTLTVEGNLAVIYLRAHRTDDGLAALTEACERRERAFGDDDPRTLTALDCLSAAHRLLGHVGEAIRLGEVVAAGRARVLGTAHPDTLASRLGLGLAYAQARVTAQAIAVLTEATDDADAALGVHRYTIELRSALACCHAVAGEQAVAEAEYDRAIADASELFGADHRGTVELRAERAELDTPGPEADHRTSAAGG